MHRDVRKPLVIFTPKSLLRSPKAFSDISRFSSGSFEETLDDPVWTSGERDRDAVETVLLASGKVAFDLMDERDERELDVPVARVEQLYPFPADQIRDILAAYPNAKDVCWVQEEPENMGPWGFVDGRLWNLLEELDDGRELRRASRVPSASPAAGQHVVHEQEHEQLMDDALGPATP